MNLREARMKRQVTQWDLRLRAGINQSKVSLIERGYVQPSEEEKAAIAKALGLRVDEIEWAQAEAAA
ncbi:MAG: helix-turn-helix transcriptional regulator [Desulfobacterales bacterium]|nr:helix-turn-helix transcriptional regulator [Desulfobacterales bacterium]